MKTIKDWLLLVVISCVLHSCKSTNNNDSSVYLQLNNQLENATNVIKNVTSIYMHRLDSKTFDPSTVERAKIWLPRAIQVQQLTSELFVYLDGIKLAVKSAPGLSLPNSLPKTIGSYSRAISVVDSTMTNQFKKEINELSALEDSLKVESSNLAREAIICLLSKTQNQLSILENHLVVYCDNQVASNFDGYYKTMPFVHQNSTHLRNNEELQIDVSVVNPVNPIVPKVYINGDSISRSDNGFYHYQLKVAGKPGKYALPIKIEYYEYQEKVSVDKTVVYYVD